MNEKELKTFSTYKEFAYRSLRFLYRHPNVGYEKLNSWISQWYEGFEYELMLEKEAFKDVF